MVRIEIDNPEFSIVLGGLIRMAQAAKAAREQAVVIAEKAETPEAFDALMEIAAHKQTIIDQAFATLSSVGKSARENMSHLAPDPKDPRLLRMQDDRDTLDALKWAADMWSEVVGEHPILNADGTVYKRPNQE
jgi:hypothetical protein